MVDRFGDLLLQVVERVARVAFMTVAVSVQDFVDRVLDVRRQLVVDRSGILQLLRQGEQRRAGRFGGLWRGPRR